ncbi:MAG: PSD1 and planctomycete cytochrome C domain-containing protein [Planctomycetota bacterium]
MFSHPVLTLASLLGVAAAQTAPRFDRDVQPILAAKCFACHGPDAGKRKAELRLDVRAEAVANGAVVPRDPAASELCRRIEHPDPGERMPPKTSGLSLTPAERSVLRAWIADGAEYETHWAFVPPQRSALPADDDCGFVRNPVDAWILAAMRARGLSPSPEAPRAALLRRLSLDLTGLPPEPEDVAAFESDPTPAAYENAVDRLLASPHYGEHMALPWLDAARYADSNGYQHDGDRQAWPWRDWLVSALNDNRRFDQVVVEMLAGDLLPAPTTAQIVATALQRHHAINNEGGAIAEEVRFQYGVDRVHTFATAFLGLTVACAQCHDHKFDPISQRDYYGLFAFFVNPDEDAVPSLHRRSRTHFFQIAKPWVDLATDAQRTAIEAAKAAYEKVSARYRSVEGSLVDACEPWLATATEAALAAAPDAIARAVRRHREAPLTGTPLRRVRSWFAREVSGCVEWAQAQGQLDAAEAELAHLYETAPVVMVMREAEQPLPVHVHARGAYDQPIGPPLEPAVPAALGSLAPDARRDRLALARWLVAPDHPLFARVVVNRVWQGLFGRGLVATPEDFGVTGARPTHPELLDWLACEFVASGFDLKALTRGLVTSATYRQSSVTTAEHLAADPGNVWLARSPRYRLSSFALRDQALALSGLLDHTLGGPPTYPYHPAGLWLDVSFEVFAYPELRAGDLHRRSLYTFWRRTVAPPTLFDAASRQTCVVRPARTDTPLHALVLLDDPTFVEAARALARRTLQAEGDDVARLGAMFRRATARAPGPDELAVLQRALERERARFARAEDRARAYLAVGLPSLDHSEAPAELAAWTALAQLVLNLDEVLNRS